MLRRCRPLALLSLAMVSSAVVACSKEPATPPATYEVRGLIVEVSGDGDDARATVHHEDIPGFRDRKGQAVGMKSMKMSFGVGPDVDPATLAAGKKLQLTIEVDWDKRPSITITRSAPLPDDTELELR
ncbi:MAG: copper-binding protein [Myxococcales bacterium]|jgi:hypothetical protein